jgi:hypothetical protein
LGAGLTRNWNELAAPGLPSRYDFGTSVAYTQPLLAGAWESVNLSSLIAAKQGALRGRLALRATSLDLIRDTEIAYWSRAGARTLVALRQSSLRSAESLLAQVQAKRSLGDATVLEELQAAADVASQRVAVLNASQSVDGAEMSLRRLLGLGTVEEVQAVLAVQPLGSAPIPPLAPAPPIALPTRRAAWRRWRPWLLLALLAALLAGLGLWQRQQKASGRDVAPYTVLAQSGELPGVVTAAGELDAVERVNVSPKRQGLIEQLFVDEGDTVKAGQAIARMDAGDLRDRAQELAANIRSAEAELERSASELRRNEPL